MQYYSIKKIFKIPLSLSNKFSKIISTIPNRSYYNYFLPNTIESILALQKILLCKIVDETNSDFEPLFYTFPLKHRKDESSNESETINRMNKLFELVKNKYPGIFEPNENLNLSSNTIMKGILELQSYSISKADKNMVKEAYDYIIETLIEKENISNSYQGGGFFMSKPIADFVVNLLEPTKKNSTILNPSMGFGNLLLSCSEYIDKYTSNNNLVNYPPKLYGCEINKSVVLIAKINAILHGKEDNNLFFLDRSNILLKPIIKNNEQFDIILTHPSYVTYSEHRKLLNQIKFIPKNKSKNNGLNFLELGLEHLAPGGKMAIFSSIDLLYSAVGYPLRRYLLDNNLLKAIIEFPSGIPFQHNTIIYYLLLIEKPISDIKLSDYKIFMADIKMSKDTYQLFDIIIKKYREFKKGKELSLKKLGSLENLTLFLVNKSDLKETSWVVEYQYHLFKKKILKMKQVKLENIAHIIPGINLNIHRNLQVSDNKVILIDASDIIDNRINYENIRQVNANTIFKASNYAIKKNDILITVAGIVGKVVLIDVAPNNAIAGPNTVLLRIKKEVILPEFLYNILRSEYVRD